MAKRVAYFYFMRSQPHRVREIVPSHVEYWRKAMLEKFKGGPFTGSTGGLIHFETTSLEEATKVIEQDPFLLEDVIETKWIKEWMPK